MDLFTLMPLIIVAANRFLVVKVMLELKRLFYVLRYYFKEELRKIGVPEAR
jgi:hypothetical protein